MKTAEQLLEEHWTGENQYGIFRHGKKDGIVVLLDNPSWKTLASCRKKGIVGKEKIEGIKKIKGNVKFVNSNSPNSLNSPPKLTTDSDTTTILYHCSAPNCGMFCSVLF